MPGLQGQSPRAFRQADPVGVNMSRVIGLVIGAGNRTSPVKGGAGIVYLDDLGFGRSLR